MFQQSHSWVHVGELKAGTHTHTHMLMSMAALLTPAQGWKQPKRSSTHEWISKMWHHYTMQHYWLIKRRKLTHATKWMKLQDVLLGENELDGEGQMLCDSTYMRSPP